MVRNDNFTDKFGLQEDRMNFVRKVYGILGMQLLLTALFTVIAVYSESLQQFMVKNVWLIIVAFIG